MNPGELVDMFARVLGVRDAVAELKVERLEQLVAEEVTLDHSEVVHRLRPDGELNTVGENNDV